MRLHPVFMSAFSVLSVATMFPAQSGQTKYIEPPMASIPKGTFVMGSEQGREDEKPTRKVSVPAFQMAKYEVTVAEYRKFIEATGYEYTQGCAHRIGRRWFGSGERDGTWDDNIYVLSEFHPVVCVSRKDAVNYAKWLSKVSGKHYRLPTEAEWEYAARAGTTTKYYFGDEGKSQNACRYSNVADLHAYSLTEKLYNASYGGGYTVNDCNDNEVLISTVGLYEPNRFGVYDMIGNVVERVADCYKDSYQGAPTDGSAVKENGCEVYVGRGGSWHWAAHTSSQRMSMNEDFFAALEGFRLVRDTKGKDIPASQGTPWFVKKLSAAQQKVKAKHVRENPKYPTKPKNLKVSSHDNGNNKVTWQSAGKGQVTGYQVYRQDPLKNVSTLLAKNHKTAHFIDKKPLQHNARYHVIALNGDAKSLPSASADSGSKTAHVIPSRIQGEAFNFAPGVDVINSGFEPESDKIISSIGKSKASYFLAAKEAGKYKMDIRLFHSGADQRYWIKVNGNVITTPALSGERGWKTIQGIEVNLSKGRHTLTVQGEASLFAVNWFDIQKM
ncbi:SUMF1/EgtB/PvdO family nonheme iron enzyme [Pseudoalteromonas luteoviolacea]|uniref:Sulfatase-modifying factor enzyme-like domain-containing protein n=1 Tax=Pseudoalteromonas luteoviolacea (strain 2ta16) TaxID=1353533 RepID=V4HV81_PSEL2|nr:SUMF1/EgtB/PvdO family nonheme iron enzyme [Pseudoalteromonas luteoviolacea]ESP94745.1 hypothetical protein PL2TA16_00745 [Pseudoalteromonas luteoviolacea 2ta16]KZN43391.1 hypothetical protein N483_08845 [Pseudoalteromonas luteoviolacea NCIMB 1944]